MENYTLKGIDISSNSHKSKEEKKDKQIPKITQAKIKKKTLSQRFSETFIKSDVESVGGYIFFDVLVPAIVDTFRDIVNSSLDMFLYGDVKGRNESSRSVSNRNRTFISYRDCYDDGRRRRDNNAIAKIPRSSWDDVVVFETREKAKETRDMMLDLIDEYEMVSVREFREMCGLDFEFTDEKYGWTNLSSVSITGTPRDGYVINLPRPILLVE